MSGVSRVSLVFLMSLNVSDVSLNLNLNRLHGMRPERLRPLKAGRQACMHHGSVSHCVGTLHLKHLLFGPSVVHMSHMLTKINLWWLLGSNCQVEKLRMLIL